MALAADRSVRLATAADAPAMAVVQREAWRYTYRGVLPDELLDGLDVAELAAGWRQAVVSPPGPGHRVLVALQEGVVVGFAAAAPASDPDLDPATDAEVAALLVDPAHQRGGHGSRLLQAVVDTLRPLDVHVAHLWLGPAESALRTFIEDAGWAPDGATRELDLTGDGSTVVAQERLHTLLADAAAHEHDHH